MKPVPAKQPGECLCDDEFALGLELSMEQVVTPVEVAPEPHQFCLPAAPVDLGPLESPLCRLKGLIEARRLASRLGRDHTLSRTDPLQFSKGALDPCSSEHQCLGPGLDPTISEIIDFAIPRIDILG